MWLILTSDRLIPQAEAEDDMATAKRIATAGSSPLFEALTSRESSPAAQDQPPSCQTSPITHDRVTQRSAVAATHSPAGREDASSSKNMTALHDGGTEQNSNPFLRPGEEDPFAARVQLKEWQIAGPPTAPAYVPPRGHLAPRDLDRSLEISQQRGRPAHAAGPLADSAASLNMSAFASSRQAAAQQPNAVSYHAPRPSAIAEETSMPGASGNGSWVSESSSGAPQTADVTRHSSGNPFKDEHSSPGPAGRAHGSTLESATSSGNPFLDAQPSVQLRGMPSAAPACRKTAASGRQGSLEGWPQWPEDSQGYQPRPQPHMYLPRSPHAQKAA